MTDTTGPMCCGQPSKWVEISVNLKYHFCTKCKNEVTEGSSGILQPRKLFEGTDAADAAQYLLSAQMPTPSLPPPLPTVQNGPTRKFSCGDRVFVNDPGIVGTDLPAEVIAYVSTSMVEIHIDHGSGFGQICVVHEKYLSTYPKYANTSQTKFRVGDRVRVMDKHDKHYGMSGTVQSVGLYVEVYLDNGPRALYTENEINFLP